MSGGVRDLAKDAVNDVVLAAVDRRALGRSIDTVPDNHDLSEMDSDSNQDAVGWSPHMWTHRCPGSHSPERVARAGAGVRKKLCVVAPYYYPKVGGVENYALHMVRASCDHGFDTFVITTNHESKRLVCEEIFGVRVYRLPVLFRVSNSPINPLWRRHIRTILQEERPTVINGHEPVPYLADVTERVRCGIPFILTYHNDLVKSGVLTSALVRVVNATLVSRTLRRADRIIVTSHYYAERSRYLRRHLERVRVVPPGVDARDRVSGPPAMWYQERFGDSRVLLFVGTLDRSHSHKGLERLIRALPFLNCRSVRLVVIGQGNHVAHYQRVCEECGVAERVSFEGYVDDETLREFYSCADVIVVPSEDAAEGFGMVLLEAALCGTPAVATDVGGIPAAVVDGVTGILVPPKNQDALCDALDRVVSDGALRQRLGRQAAERAREFEWSRVCREYIRVLAEVGNDDR
jgi:glycosyltransferase involved in cell wall biosynthesis